MHRQLVVEIDRIFVEGLKNWGLEQVDMDVMKVNLLEKGTNILSRAYCGNLRRKQFAHCPR